MNLYNFNLNFNAEFSEVEFDSFISPLQLSVLIIKIRFIWEIKKSQNIYLNILE